MKNSRFYTFVLFWLFACGLFACGAEPIGPEHGAAHAGRAGSESGPRPFLFMTGQGYVNLVTTYTGNSFARRKQILGNVGSGDNSYIGNSGEAQTCVDYVLAVADEATCERVKVLRPEMSCEPGNFVLFGPRVALDLVDHSMHLAAYLQSARELGEDDIDRYLEPHTPEGRREVLQSNQRFQGTVGAKPLAAIIADLDDWDRENSFGRGCASAGPDIELPQELLPAFNSAADEEPMAMFVSLEHYDSTHPTRGERFDHYFDLRVSDFTRGVRASPDMLEIQDTSILGNANPAHYDEAVAALAERYRDDPRAEFMSDVVTDPWKLALYMHARPHLEQNTAELQHGAHYLLTYRFTAKCETDECRVTCGLQEEAPCHDASSRCLEDPSLELSDGTGVCMPPEQ